MKYTKHITIIGLLLFSIYLLQDLLNIKLPLLENLQAQQNYKRWSGYAVGLLIVLQWLLTFSRVIPKLRRKSAQINNFHKWLGAFSPLILFFHSTAIGFGYLALFSYLFLTNVLLGTINLDVIKSTKNWIFKSWMITHVALSMCITFLLVLHICTVYYFK